MGSFVCTLAQTLHTFNMKFLVLAAAFAVSSAQVLVTHPNGGVVPADTPEVYAAKVAHAAAGGAVLPVGVVGYPYAYAGLVAHPNGAIVPVEPADVVQARADHLAAHSA